jgi:prepilin peptidase CpaA
MATVVVLDAVPDLSAVATVTRDGVFTFGLALAAVWDARARRIPNALTVALALAGLAFAVGRVGMAGAGPGTAALALLTGLLVWLPFYALRMLGAGDVKLFAAAAAWLTPMATLEAALYTALFGGVLGIVWMVRTRGLAFAAIRLGHAIAEPRQLREPMPVASGQGRLPYGIAMAVGLLLEAWRIRYGR